nr:NADH dehydrogenase subunit 1 [Polyplax reclinata]
MTNFILLISFLLMVAFFTLFERKIMGLAQSRLGPSKVFLKGIGQPFSDVLKLLSKVSTSIKNESEVWYYLSPFFMLLVSALFLSVLPFGMFQTPNSSGVIALFILSISALWLTLSGWFSNSAYATLGVGRSICLSLSFEIPLALIFISLFLTGSSFSLASWKSLSLSLFFLQPWCCLAATLCLLAEVGRSPFDLAEGESELVSGFNVEYGGSLFTMIFLSETLTMLVVSSILSLFMFSECGGPLFLLTLAFLTAIRPSVPRIRFDQAMSMAWLIVTPLMISATVLSAVWGCSYASRMA